MAAANITPFYLPQLHESEENNYWWGRGFVEWLNVVAVIPA